MSFPKKGMFFPTYSRWHRALVLHSFAHPDACVTFPQYISVTSYDGATPRGGPNRSATETDEACRFDVSPKI